jgi:tripartite-type tricarboxylate transporter receptor subunit TctC
MDRPRGALHHPRAGLADGGHTHLAAGVVMSPLSMVWRWAAALVLAAAGAVAPGHTQSDYPSRGITLVMPLAPGSAGDVLGRLVANKMSAELGRSIVVENVTGASGAIGIDRVNRSDPDGYTVLGTGDNQLIYAVHFNKSAKFDPLKDFTAVTQLATIDWALVANPALPAKSVAELVALAKAKPGQIDFSSGGKGSAQHIAMELFMAKTGVKLNHVPYRGATPALNDVVSGVVSTMFTALSVAQPFIQNGTLRVLASAGTKRSDLMPEVPTLAEAGVDGFEFTTWMGFLLPAKTPPEVVKRVHASAVSALNDPEVRARSIASGFTVVGNTPDEFKAVVARDFERIGDIIRSAGITAN